MRRYMVHMDEEGQVTRNAGYVLAARSARIPELPVITPGDEDVPLDLGNLIETNYVFFSGVGERSTNFVFDN